MNARAIAEELIPTGFSIELKTDRAGNAVDSFMNIESGGSWRTVRIDCDESTFRHAVRVAIGELLSDTPFMTATGVDEQTDMERLDRWGLPDVEFGFLYSAQQAGVAKRYPSWQWIVNNAGRVRRSSLHVCGNAALKQLLNGELDVSAFQRIQINGRRSPQTILDVCGMFPRHTIILRYADPEKDSYLLAGPLCRCANIELLVDASGGNGVLPDSWPALPTNRKVGFAGGLNPENMTEQVRRIRQVAKPGWWVDLESGLRDEEWFSEELLRRAHKAFRDGLS